jgi:hypothetical protein
MPCSRSRGPPSGLPPGVPSDSLTGHEYIPVWLNRPLVALGHRKPIDVLAAGGYDELSRIVAGLEAPTFS